MDKRSALLIDPSVVGQSHLLVNTGMVRLVALRYARIAIIAENTHCDALKKYLGAEISNQVTFVPWHRRSEIRKTVRGFIAGEQFDQIIFTNLEYGIFAYMNLFHKRASSKPILWTLHSHLLKARSSGKAARIKNVVKWYFLFRAFRKVKFIVLGERIRASIEASIGSFFRRGNIVAITHPVGITKLPGRTPSAAGSLSKFPRVIFMSGWHGLSPNNKELLSKIERLPPKNHRFEFVALSNKFQAADAQREKSFLTDYADRLNEIARADFFLHLPSDSYKLQASGALMDMLLTGTPVIGLRTDFGDELTEIIGPFGYFFDKHDDLLTFFSSAELDPAEVYQFRFNLAAGCEKIVALNQAQFDAAVAS
ncbi:hypothetical protein GCM10007890_01220 [Methylobacterium tardum]|uniref:Uncharacterized protein n=1 Tax=Methylobacterium tardum TaxID=374432 RepID=A0AA37WPE3_9HYPH|nr:hypothetical protein GCM10007890_01220 [Methylobacterium tardum]